MRTLICGLLALVSAQALASDRDLRCERYAEVQSIVQSVKAPAGAGEPADLPQDLNGALDGWLAEGSRQG